MRVGCNSGQVHDTRKNSSTVNASAKTTRDTSAFKLKLRTAEGDTVEISLDAQNQSSTERASASAADGKISQQSNSQSDSLTVAVKVTGNLSDGELSDIQGLLKSLAGGDTPQAGQGELDTISAYQYSYQQTHEVSRAKLQLYG